MKNKTAQIILVTILAGMLPYNGAQQAPSFPQPTIVVKCSNLDTSILAYEIPATGETYEDLQKRVADQTIKNLHAVVPICKEDLTPVLDPFELEIIKWVNLKKRRLLLDKDLIVEPYSINRASEIQKDKNNLLACKYEESQHIGNWLIVFETARPYCYILWKGLQPPALPSLWQFLIYLIANLSLTTLPYLACLLLAGGAIIYVWWILLKDRPLLKDWKLITLSIVMLPAGLFLIIVPFWVLSQVIGWILFFFILVLWNRHLKKQKSAFGQEAG